MPQYDGGYLTVKAIHNYLATYGVSVSYSALTKEAPEVNKIYILLLTKTMIKFCKSSVKHKKDEYRVKPAHRSLKKRSASNLK